MKDDHYRMNCYQRLAALSYLSQLKRPELCHDLNYVVGFDRESGATCITGEAADSNVAIRVIEKYSDVVIEVSDIDRPTAEWKELKMYGRIRLKYGDTNKLFEIIKESAYMLDPAQVIADTFVQVTHAIFDYALHNICYTDFVGEEYGFDDAVVIKVIGMMTIEKMVYGVMRGKMTIIAFPKYDYITKKQIIEELSENIFVLDSVYAFIDSIRIADFGS